MRSNLDFGPPIERFVQDQQVIQALPAHEAMRLLDVVKHSLPTVARQVLEIYDKGGATIGP